jgi:hypothetical protein
MRRLDSNEFVEIEIDNRLRCLDDGGVAQGLGQRFEPSHVLALQGDEFSDSVRQRWWWLRRSTGRRSQTTGARARDNGPAARRR